MDLALPDKDKDKTEDAPPPETPAWRTMTVVLGNANKLVYYIGQASKPEEGTPKVENYGGKGIRKVILDKQEAVKARVAGLGANPEKDGLTILIKATKSSNYKKFSRHLRRNGHYENKSICHCGYYTRRFENA